MLPLTWREAYEINMAGLAATRLFSAGGAGGIALTYWALRKAGMERRQSACRMVAFLALQYIWYPLALIVFGILLRTGVLSGNSDVGVTIVPAAIAGIILVLGILIALIPQDFERRIAKLRAGPPQGRPGPPPRLRPGDAGDRDADGVRPGQPSLRGAASRSPVRSASGRRTSASSGRRFRAFGVHVPLGVVVQGFFIGMLANLFPFAPAGVGAVDAGMIGAFFLFDLPHTEVLAAVLVYRVIAFWLPIPPGIIAFFQLRRTVSRWEQEGRPADTDAHGEPIPVGRRMRRSAPPILQKVK